MSNRCTMELTMVLVKVQGELMLSGASMARESEVVLVEINSKIKDEERKH